MKELFIFDFDGTLFDTLKQLVINMNQALDYFDFPVLSLDEYKFAVGGNANQVISNILGDNSSKENISKVKNRYFEIVEVSEDNISRPFDGVYELLKLLEDEGIQLAINSNRFTASIEGYVDNFFGDISFVDIQGHNPPNPSKPDAYGVESILDRTDFTRDEALYVGDSITDIKTAENAGVDCVIVDWGYSDYEKIRDMENIRMVSDVMDLLDFIG